MLPETDWPGWRVPRHARPDEIRPPGPDEPKTVQYLDMTMTRRPHYAWIILAVTFLALLAGAGIRATPSVLIVPLEQEFGWSRSTISFAISINIFLYGLMGPFAGALMQRLGVRRTTLVTRISCSRVSYISELFGNDITSK